ncbi:hypothetical protein ACOME3_004178 [Neoechinorhynchus agilis]
MPGFIALRLCPNLKIITGHYSKYHEESTKIAKIIEEFDSKYLTAGIDEFYLDVTTQTNNVEHYIACLRSEIYKQTGLTASAGIACNTRLAKLCSDINKPNGQFDLRCSDRKERSIRDFIDNMDVSKIKGIGKVYSGYGTSDLDYLRDSEVKSVGHETTFESTSCLSFLEERCAELCKDVEQRLQKSELPSPRKVVLKLKLDDFETLNRTSRIPGNVFNHGSLLKASLSLLKSEFKQLGKRKVRLLGVRVIDFVDGGLSRFLAPDLTHHLFGESGDNPRIAQRNTFFTRQISEDEVHCPICDLSIGSLKDNRNINGHLDNCLTERFLDDEQQFKRPKKIKKPKRQVIDISTFFKKST